MPRSLTRRGVLKRLAAGAALLLSAVGCRRSHEPLVGFSQMDAGGVWRVAETNSMRHAAAAAGFGIVVTNAEDQTAKQISDIEDLIARRVLAVFVAPREFDGVEAALETARRARVPVFLIDREAEGAPGVDYVTFIGSDFVEQGRRAGRWLVKATGGRAGVLELTGTAGSSVARDRARGFREGIAGADGVRIVASQTASFARATGQAVTANVLQALGREITAIYAHNDEMALGAIEGVRAVSLQPGRDVTLVSIDGERAALEAILAGDLGASVESDPRFGPVAFDALRRYLAGEAVPPRIVLKDRVFDASNVSRFIDEAY